MLSSVLNVIFACLLIWLACKYFDLKNSLNPSEKRYYNLINAISEIVDKVELYDTQHAREVKDIALSIARKTPMSTKQLETLETAALLHDIGMLMVGSDSLKSGESLSEDESYLMRTHPLLAEFYLKKEMTVSDDIPSTIRWHHERWDGFGYPDGLRGNQIPLPARILALADSISSMKHDRISRDKKYETIEDILDELKKQAGLQFDPSLVKIYIQIAHSENTSKTELAQQNKENSDSTVSSEVK